MQIEGATILVTGTSRGIGRAYVEGLLAAGAGRLYAAARDPKAIADLVAAGSGRVVPIALDVTQPAMVAAAAEACGDTQILINNAGINANAGLIAAADDSHARAEIETNYFGTLAMCRAFAPILARNGGGLIVNMLSITARVSIPLMGSLSASKAASWRMTQGVRAELRGQGTRVMGIFPGAVDTEMTRDFQGPKIQPAEVVAAVITAIRNGPDDVYPGEMAQGIHAGLAADPDEVERQLSAVLPPAAAQPA